eukprot:1260929-Prymnesium_polylepis.1
METADTAARCANASGAGHFGRVWETALHVAMHRPTRPRVRWTLRCARETIGAGPRRLLRAEWCPL